MGGLQSMTLPSQSVALELVDCPIASLSLEGVAIPASDNPTVPTTEYRLLVGWQVLLNLVVLLSAPPLAICAHATSMVISSVIIDSVPQPSL